MMEIDGDFISFDRTDEDIDRILSQFHLTDQTTESLGGNNCLRLLVPQAYAFFDAVRAHPINPTEGEGLVVLGKRHYNLNKALLALFEFSVIEAAAVAAVIADPSPTNKIALATPVVAVFTKWREIVTPLEQEEINVLRAMTTLIKADHRVLRENGYTVAEIERALEADGPAVNDVSEVLDRLSSEGGKNRVVNRLEAEGVVRYSPIR